MLRLVCKDVTKATGEEWIIGREREGLYSEGWGMVTRSKVLEIYNFQEAVGIRREDRKLYDKGVMRVLELFEDDQLIKSRTFNF